MRRFAAVVAVSVMLVGLVACGKHTTKAAFVAKADPLCQRTAAVSAPAGLNDLNGLKDAAAKVGDAAAHTAAALRKLSKPGGNDGKLVDGLIEELEAGARAGRSMAGAADVEAAADTMANKLFDATTKASALGSTQCARAEREASAKIRIAAGPAVKAAYIAKADALCKAANVQLDALPQPDTFAAVKAFLDKAIEVGAKLTSDLKALPPPKLDKDKLDAALAANDVALAKAREAQAAAAAGQQRKALDLLDEVGKLGDASNAKADAYGFKDCGSQG